MKEEINIQRTSKMQSRMKKGKEQRKSIKERGITLVALVITIVILIILATVSINIVFGEGGLIQRAQEAKELTEQATLEEQEALNSLLDEFANVMAEDPTIPEGPTVPEEWDLSKVTPVLSEDNQYVPVPKGFTASTVEGEKSVNDGFVIKEGNDGSLTEGINEFVWIPVDEESLSEMYIVSETPISLSGSTGVTTNIYSNLRVRSGDSYTADKPGTTNAREPDSIVGSGTSYDASSTYYSILASSAQEMAQNMVDEYEATYNSIKKYNGFYIGRYELTGTVDSPTVQKNQTVIVSQNWYNQKKACSNIVDTEYAKSEMIYGNQWDEVMDWLIDTEEKTEDEINVDSRSWGNYKDSTGEATTNSGSLQTSGKNEAWKANNIYDLAGNAYDWTQEAYYTNIRIYRGGYCLFSGSITPASDRSNDYNAYYSFSGVSSRPALYIK